MLRPVFCPGGVAADVQIEFLFFNFAQVYQNDTFLTFVDVGKTECRIHA
jgi:hypothetical protein